MTESLLSHIASSFINQYENVANSSLCYLLNKYREVREALENLTGIETQLLDFKTEYVTDYGRPDIVGISANGAHQKQLVSLIIEGKFWAGLTKNQPVEYIKILSPEGQLLFLAPSKRVDSLIEEIKVLLGEQYSEEKIKVTSWIDFIERTKNIPTPSSFNAELQSDLYQLERLCEYVDVESMPPLDVVYLDPVHGRVTHQLASLLDDCKVQVRRWKESDFSGLSSGSGKSWTGFYFRSHGFACQLFFSSYRWFMENSKTPFFLTVWDGDFKPSQRVSTTLESQFGDLVYKIDGTSAYAIKLEPGQTREQAIAHIVSEVRVVLEFLYNHLE